MTFHVGQKVVCVDAGPYKHSRTPTGLVLNATYTVAAIYTDLGPRLTLVNVAEISGDSVTAFYATRFRPVRKTDISIFTSMLNNVPLHEKENV